jgi:plasmid stability protein
VTSITIHNIEPETGEMIRRLAATQGLSLNQQVKRLLRKALGLTEQGEMPPRDFSEFSGVWTRKEAEAFDAATARSIDPEDWR